MDLRLPAFLCAIVLVRYGECTFTEFTTPAVAGTSGKTHKVAAIAENKATTESVITLVTDTDGAVACKLLETTPANNDYFTVSADCSIKPTAKLDRDNGVEIVKLKVEAKDAETTGDIFIEIPISDLNDNSPTFSTATKFTALRDRACSGTPVDTCVATDADATDPNKKITYSISEGNDGKLFSIDENGKVMVAEKMEVNYGKSKKHTLTIKAKDGGATSLEDTMKLTIYICSAPSVVISLLLLFVSLLVSMG